MDHTDSVILLIMHWISLVEDSFSTGCLGGVCAGEGGGVGGGVVRGGSGSDESDVKQQTKPPLLLASS